MQQVPAPVEAERIDVQRKMQLDLRARFSRVTPPHRRPLGYAAAVAAHRAARLERQDVGRFVEDDFASG
ncbi:hypothetical protein WI41_15530 [Burkholderia latens]|uniref:Uncharacterized protein n=1 Tax=Burkholderia latens TaxID=488446 RepID=A0AAP1C8A9_9BURK|nr:hypothetical protein WI41_15530 [Burkholderia latens]